MVKIILKELVVKMKVKMQIEGRLGTVWNVNVEIYK